MVASGAAVDDGSYVLTVLEYRFSMPDELAVVDKDGLRFEATVQAVDFRTGATLLRIQDGRLAAIEVNTSIVPELNGTVAVLGWSSSRFGPKPGNSSPETSAPILKETRAVVATELGGTIPTFRIRLADRLPFAASQDIDNGAVVTDIRGNVLGFVGTMQWGLIPAPGIPPGYIPQIIGIQSALELMSPDANQQIWARGPSSFTIVTPNTASAPLEPPEKYGDVAAALQQVLNGVGSPVEISEAKSGFSRFPFSPARGDCPRGILALPIGLRSADGENLAEAKWVAIHWGGEHKSVVLCGSTAFEPEGAFEIIEDTTDLQSAARISGLVE